MISLPLFLPYSTDTWEAVTMKRWHVFCAPSRLPTIFSMMVENKLILYGPLLNQISFKKPFLITSVQNYKTI